VVSLIGRDGRRYALDEPRWRGEDGSPLLVEPLPGLTRAEIEPDVRSHWRYAKALPLALSPVSLGEGWTPLLPTRIAGVDLLVKPEWFNPTGSFKDRGTSVMVSLLAHQRVPAILEDSSGNGGASVAAYAAAAGIEAKILAPESTSEAKLLQSRMHGAELELVPGPRQATADEAVRQSGERFYASHNWHPFFLHGTKLIAYELWEQLGFSAPDAVLMPTGAGSLALGCSIGFNELLRAGQIVAVPEPAIARAVRTLAALGLYAEPTSALVVAALDRLPIVPGETVVAVLTGSGLKAATTMSRILDR
jgi:threonine synthase